MSKNKILNFVKQYNAHYVNVELIGKWNGYDIYQPIHDFGKWLHLGTPKLLMVKNEIIRFASDDEFWDIYDDITGCQNA